MKMSCYCCIKKTPEALPRVCPECQHIFQGNGWDGIDAHWKAKHENIMPYQDFWQNLCDEHRGAKVITKSWNRSELLLALDLYYSQPFGKLHKTNPLIVKIAALIGRTPSAVAMKACNFASLDPAIAQKGLGNASVSDRAIWDEFSNNGVALLDEVGKIKDGINLEESVSEKNSAFDGPTEALQQIKVRRAQSFFRKSVMISYEYKCAISGISIPELLIASHIIPWAESEKRRVDPTNGIALNALYDKAFDRGFIGFDDHYNILISKEIKKMESDKKIAHHLFDLEGQKMMLPTRFLPDVKALAWHRKNRFRA